MGLPIFLFIYTVLNKNLILIGAFLICIEVYYVLANGYDFLTHFSNFGTYAFPRILIYIFLGMFVAKYKLALLKNGIYLYVAIALLLTVLFLLENILILHFGGKNDEELILTAPTSLAITFVSLKWAPRIKQPLFLRNFSTFLYCFQTYPLSIFRKVLHKIPVNRIFNTFILFVLIILFTYFVFLAYRAIYRKTETVKYFV